MVMRKIEVKLPENMTMALTSNVCKHTNDYGYEKEYPLYKASGLGVGYEMYGDELICLECLRQKEQEDFKKKMSDYAIEQEQNKRKNTIHYKSVFSDLSIKNAGFRNFDTATAEESYNLEQIKKVVQGYHRVHNKEVENFTTLLQGPPGVGKSHLAMSVLRNLNETLDVECLFVNVRRMLLMIKNSFGDKNDKHTQMYFIELLSQVDFLVIDDLGNETGDDKAKQWIKDILTEVLEARQTKCTIVTSNYTRDGLNRAYGDNTGMSALVSRLLKNTLVVKFKETSDKRIKAVDIDEILSKGVTSC